MKSFLITFLILIPTLLFSQIHVASDIDKNNIFIYAFTDITDSVGVSMTYVEHYIDDIDSLVVVDQGIRNLKLEDDGIGFYLLCKVRDKLILCKTYHFYFYPRMVFSEYIQSEDQHRYNFKIKGITEINGVKVLVESSVPREYLKPIKRIHAFLGDELLPSSVLDIDSSFKFFSALPVPTITVVKNL